MAQHPELINRAIAMHLLREGQFNVASTFIQETQALDQFQEQEPAPEGRASGTTSQPNDDTDMDADHSGAEEDGEEDDDDTIPNPDVARDAAEAGYDGGDDEPMSEVRSLQSHELQEKFSTMYQILKELRNHNLLPAISWAHENSAELDARGSDLEFELCKRQYIYLILQSGEGDEDEGPAVAMEYAQANFPRFADRHAKEIAQLASALVYQPNLAESPYAHLFASGGEAEGTSSFDEIASSFTREFCSLLGLSAESPLYVAATAGAISLPRLMMFVGVMTQARASWTTASELAFDTPLPRSMIYHSIFVCPVSKEQTTDRNPPMMLPCGHVLARDSLKNLVKSHQRYKCPYCPVEGLLRDARQIIL